MIDYSKYRKSLEHLENQFYNYRLHQNQYMSGQDNLKAIDREAIAESVIQRRVDTSHDYSEIKAQETLAGMEDFIKDAVALYRRITGESWEPNLLI